MLPLYVLISDVHLSCYYFPARSCYSFNQRAYCWLQAMNFAVKEINSEPDLLPNFTLDYLAADTCLAAMAMVTGQVPLANSECGSVPTVPVIVGDSCTSASIVVANTLGVFDIPMMRVIDVLQT